MHGPYSKGEQAMLKAVAVSTLVLIAVGSMVGITTATTAKSDQELCKAEYVHMLQSVPARTTAPHCAAMTDAQWLDINRETETVRLATLARTGNN